MNHKSFLFAIIVYFGYSFGSYSQNNNDFNAISQKGDTVYYEQWLDRNQTKYGNYLARTNKIIIPMIMGMPIGQYHKTGDTSWSANAFNHKIKLPKYQPFREYKFDFWLQPDWQFQFGNFDKAVESKGGISIYHQLPLFRGMSIFGGVQIPITNDLDEQPLNIRPASFYLNYFKSLSKFNYLNIATGFFIADRYGYKIQYIHSPLNKSWTWGFENSYSGYMYFFPKSFRYTNLQDFVALAHIAYRIKKEDISIKLTGGQFLYNDRGFRFEIMRQFTKAEVSLFSLFSKNGSTIGIDLAFRLAPGKIIQSKNFRIRSGTEYPFQYFYSRGYGIADNFKLLTDLDRTLRQFNTSYWSNETRRSSQK